jgi:hypothetical protein
VNSASSGHPILWFEMFLKMFIEKYAKFIDHAQAFESKHNY